MNSNSVFDSIDWLLNSEAAIRWQAMRDLTGTSQSLIAAERARVSREGVGEKILGCQQSDGSWRRSHAPVWLTTLFTLLLLRATGVNPADPAVEAAVVRLETTLRWSNQPSWNLRLADLGGNPFFEGEVEPCINGAVLALGGYFGRPSDLLARCLIGEQLDDGGWNCDAPKSTCSSFHTTVCVLEGLLEYERAVGHAPEILAARRRGEEYLLKRSLFRRYSTGEVANPEFLEFAFPPRYHYDILRGLDYFRNAGMHDNASPDARLTEALKMMKEKRQPDGSWLLDRAYDEALAFSFEESAGERSRWNTLRALRVLRWCEPAG